MSLQLSDNPVLRAVQSVMKAMIGAPMDTNRRAQHGAQLEVHCREMTTAGDLLIDALRLEEEFSKIDLMQAEDDLLERWRMSRKAVEHLAENHASAVSHWREALLGRAIPTKAAVPEPDHLENKADRATVVGNALPQVAIPNVEVLEVPRPGSKPHYYKPFGPTDSIFDAWSKLQTFSSTEPITVLLIPTDNDAPIVKSTFIADGTVHSTRGMFFQDLANGIRNAGPSVWRLVRRLSSFGVPDSALEGVYHFFTGTLRMELRGVQILGLTFTVRVTFEPNLGLIPRYLSLLTEYFHCEMQSGDTPSGGRHESERVVVGFPWSLTSITLYSADRRLDEDASKITKAIIDKYAKYVKQDQVIMPTPEDPTRKVSVISDEVVAVAIHEGLFKTKTEQGRFLQIEYSPFPQGPLDEIAAGDAEFLTFARAMAQVKKEGLGAEAVTALDTPF